MLLSRIADDKVFFYLAGMGGRLLVSNFTDIANIESKTTNFNHVFF